MDALKEYQKAVDEVAGLLLPLIDQDMSLVFYDLTTIPQRNISKLLLAPIQMDNLPACSA